ncbi:hypothetical protein TELCIR_19508, partial [Teladorsagia circumcincta]
AHETCVNTLRWNRGGTLLASGSDDRRVKVWNLAGECLTVVETGHQANVFAVEFLPADEPITWTTGGRVKRLATAQDEPYLFWSASEDSYVREYDARTNAEKKLISAEEKHVKSFAVCQGRTELVAVATDEAAVPIYDRRKPDKPLLTCVNADDKCHSNFTYTTHVAFDEMGTELLVNQGCGPIYLFKLKCDDRPTVLQKIKSIIESDEEVLTNGKHTPSFTHAREQAKGYFDSKKFPEALLLYPGNSKALWRLTRSLMLLEQWELAQECIEVFKKRFPNDRSIVRLSDQISVAMDSAHAHQSHVMSDDSNVVDYSGG